MSSMTTLRSNLLCGRDLQNELECLAHFYERGGVGLWEWGVDGQSISRTSPRYLPPRGAVLPAREAVGSLRYE